MVVDRQRAIRAGKWAAALVLIPPVLFLLAAWIGSAVPRNGEWREPDEGITILIGTNGVHTEIVLPIAEAGIDWREHFPLADIAQPARPYTHVGISWGERRFFLETPSWSDFNPVTAITALTGGDGILHAAYYVRPAPAADFRPLVLRREEYRRLGRHIAAQLGPPERRRTYPGYAAHDVFYDAQGRYHLGKTCNQWTSDQLAQAGIKTGWWTPLTGGVMRWVPQLDERADAR